MMEDVKDRKCVYLIITRPPARRIGQKRIESSLLSAPVEFLMQEQGSTNDSPPIAPCASNHFWSQNGPLERLHALESVPARKPPRSSEVTSDVL